MQSVSDQALSVRRGVEINPTLEEIRTWRDDLNGRIGL